MPAPARTAAPTVTTFVVVHERQTPQHACAAGVTSGTRLSSGSARVFASWSIDTSV